MASAHSKPPPTGVRPRTFTSSGRPTPTVRVWVPALQPSTTLKPSLPLERSRQTSSSILATQSTAILCFGPLRLPACRTSAMHIRLTGSMPTWRICSAARPHTRSGTTTRSTTTSPVRQSTLSIRRGSRGVSRLHADAHAPTATRCVVRGLANVPRFQVGPGGRPVHSRRAVVSESTSG